MDPSGGGDIMNIINTIDLFPVINNNLIVLLKSLDVNDFNKQTQFPDWKVKDICAHLLDTSLRRLSNERDGYTSLEKVEIKSYEELVHHITSIADRWAIALSGLSPQIIIELTEKYQNELYVYLKTLDPYGESHLPVSWAGEKNHIFGLILHVNILKGGIIRCKYARHYLKNQYMKESYTILFLILLCKHCHIISGI